VPRVLLTLVHRTQEQHRFEVLRVASFSMLRVRPVELPRAIRLSHRSRLAVRARRSWISSGLPPSTAAAGADAAARRSSHVRSGSTAFRSGRSSAASSGNHIKTAHAHTSREAERVFIGWRGITR